MPKIAIVTDSTSDLPKEITKKYNITVVPLNVHFGEETLLDGIDINSKQFFHKLVESEYHPQTSQPSVGTFLKTYETLLKNYDSILSIHISSKLSATYTSALQASNELSSTNKNISVLDSLTGPLALGAIVTKIAKMNTENVSMDDLIKESNSLFIKNEFFGFVPTLEYLAKGGRIGKARAFMGSLLKVKPMLSCVDGLIDSVGKVRTLDKGVEFLVDKLNDHKIESLFIVHANSEDRAKILFDKAKESIDPEKIEIAEFGPVVGTHVGPGAFGIGFIIE